MSVLVSSALFYTMTDTLSWDVPGGCPGSTCISPVWLERSLSLSLSQPCVAGQMCTHTLSLLSIPHCPQPCGTGDPTRALQMCCAARPVLAQHRAPWARASHASSRAPPHFPPCLPPRGALVPLPHAETRQHTERAELRVHGRRHGVRAAPDAVVRALAPVASPGGPGIPPCPGGWTGAGRGCAAAGAPGAPPRTAVGMRTVRWRSVGWGPGTRLLQRPAMLQTRHAGRPLSSSNVERQPQH